MVKKLKSPRRLAALAVFAIIAVSAFGFAAQNTVPASKAGTGTGGVSGYTVSNIHYVLDTTDGTTATGANFTLSAAASTVFATIQGVASGACTNTSGNNWSCTFASPQSIGVAFDTFGVNAAQ
jgi:hypothetical protein